jgi:hypothetical protein
MKEAKYKCWFATRAGMTRGKDDSRNDRNDARELAELLYRIKIEAVYHGEHGLRTLKELARSYLALSPRVR